MFIMLKVLKTRSLDTSADGNIRMKHIQTPSAQDMLISLEDFLFWILTIKGMFQNGRTTAATIPIISIISFSP